MKTSEQIESLGIIQNYIIEYSDRLLRPMPEQFLLFGTESEWRDQQEINNKCMMFWTRKFNKVLNQLKIQ